MSIVKRRAVVERGMVQEEYCSDCFTILHHDEQDVCWSCHESRITEALRS